MNVLVIVIVFLLVAVIRIVVFLKTKLLIVKIFFALWNVNLELLIVDREVVGVLMENAKLFLMKNKKNYNERSKCFHSLFALSNKATDLNNYLICQLL